MTPTGFLKLYAATTSILFAVDLVWLGLVAKGFYGVVAAAAFKLASWVT
jgi:hypothetical protein